MLKGYFKATAERTEIFLTSQLPVFMWLQNTINSNVQESYARTFKVLYIPFILTESNGFSYPCTILSFQG